jgi:hypothetical protein
MRNRLGQATTPQYRQHLMQGHGVRRGPQGAVVVRGKSARAHAFSKSAWVRAASS